MVVALVAALLAVVLTADRPVAADAPVVWDAKIRYSTGPAYKPSPPCSSSLHGWDWRVRVSVGATTWLTPNSLVVETVWNVSDGTNNYQTTGDTWVQVDQPSGMLERRGTVCWSTSSTAAATLVSVRFRRNGTAAPPWLVLGVDGTTTNLAGTTKAETRGPLGPATSPEGVWGYGVVPPWVEDPSTSFGDRDSAAYDGDPVNVATGNLTETAVDLDFPATVAGLDWARTYNSRNTAATALGRGWTPAFGANLATAVNGKVTLTEDDGRRLVFVPNGLGGYLRPPEFRGDLVTQADGTRRVLYFDGRTDRFDASGRLVQRSFWDGQSVALAYTTSNLTAVTHSTGRSLALAYTAGRLTSVTADDGRSATYAYDGDGDLATVAVTAGGTTTYATDSAGRVTKVTDPDGVEVIANVYGPHDRLVSQTTPSGDTVTFAYDDALGRTTVARTGSGSFVVYAYDRSGRVTSVTDPFGEVVTKTWDAQGRLTSVVDRRGAGVATTYDAHGNPLSRSEPGDVTQTFTWDASDRLASATNGEGETTTFTYDGAERIPATVTDPEGGVTASDVVAGLVESVTDADVRRRWRRGQR